METSDGEKMPARSRTSWSPEEDNKLKAYIKRYGIWNWSQMPQAAGLTRSRKSCRLQWMNYLRPDTKRGNFSQEEKETIVKCHELLGNRTDPLVEDVINQYMIDQDEINFSSSNASEIIQSIWEQPHFSFQDIFMPETDPEFMAPTTARWHQEPMYSDVCYDTGYDFWVD
ncbi:myb-related protein Zm1-like [Carya illinoinensis]|uniref:myb-related protein Zm1-like n=1 Tax=Carya illinoinensis TaxID=32201 RepID=UPI001C71A6E4|nr:myb-related protein Zm1-like [Carya illinoinensis]